MISVGALNEFLSEAIEDNPVDIFSPELFQTHPNRKNERGQLALAGRPTTSALYRQTTEIPAAPKTVFHSSSVGMA
jgi:hypothetical protein